MGVTNDGTYTIGVKAIDTVGNTTQTNLILTITNTAPSLSVSQPITGIYSGLVTLDRTATDPANGDLPLNTVIRYTNGTSS
jgi:hypothetical protein